MSNQIIAKPDQSLFAISLKNIWESLNIGVVISEFNEHLTILDANTTAHNIVGITTDKLIGQNWSEFYSHDTLEKIFNLWHTVRENERLTKRFHFNIKQFRADKSEIYVDLDSSLFVNPTNNKLCHVALMFDLSEQHKQLEQLTLEKAAKEAADMAKSRFLAHMSHEIRTPLNGVIGVSELLMGTDLTTKQREYVNLVNISGKSLLFLINDVLDYSKIEAERLDVENDNFDLHTTVESVLGILSIRAHDKSLELCGSFASDVPRFVYGDSGRLRQVLINLVGNALKFTEKGGVKVNVSVQKITLSPIPCDNDSMNDEIVIKFSVSDTGIGIPESGLSKLFSSFSQVDDSTSKKFDGSGLGLAISMHLVKLMQGELNVESKEGEGSTFWFTIPFKSYVDIRECPANSEHKNKIKNNDKDKDKDKKFNSNNSTNSSNVVVTCNKNDTNEKPICPRTGLPYRPEGCKKIMHGTIPLSNRAAIVVDDVAIQRETLAEQLASWGMDVSQAKSKEEAIQMLLIAAKSGMHYQLAIIDSSIEDGEGMDLVCAMKDEPLLNKTAIILLTPLTVDTDIAVIHSTGVAANLSKPVYSSSLFDATITALFAQEKEKNDANRQLQANQLADIPEKFDERRSLITVLIAEDNKINQIITRDTLENVGFKCVVVDNGKIATEVYKADKFDLILMDCQMPEMDGFQATMEIRRNETAMIKTGKITKKVPIIALTANATKADRDRCLQCGMDAYCSKPINQKTLVRTIDQWVKPILISRLMNYSHEIDMPFSTSEFFILCGKNKMIASMVLSDFLTQIPKDLEAIQICIENLDYGGATPIIQHLRGKANLLGANMLVKNATILEDKCHTKDNETINKQLDNLFDEANICLKHAAKTKEILQNDSLDKT
ncbi:MAG: response regulator [Planctomycetaceae bacterium]|jgi:PAS domain S-box-containing protein|nr:response regulator [Planctomycetaceae bacterium]